MAPNANATAAAANQNNPIIYAVPTEEGNTLLLAANMSTAGSNNSTIVYAVPADDGPDDAGADGGGANNAGDGAMPARATEGDYSSYTVAGAQDAGNQDYAELGNVQYGSMLTTAARGGAMPARAMEGDYSSYT
jgi:hypothetical protein